MDTKTAVVAGGADTVVPVTKDPATADRWFRPSNVASTVALQILHR